MRLDLFVTLVVCRRCMKTRTFLQLGLLLTLFTSPLLQAKDEARISYPSKVSSAKAKEREKLLSPWMGGTEFDKHLGDMEKQNKQLIYFEYDGAKDLWRGITTSAVRFDSGYTYWTMISELEAAKKLNDELKEGHVPAFICRDGNTYTMLFVHPDHLAAARKELEALGIGEPKIKK